MANSFVIEPSFYWRFDGNFSVASLGAEAFIWSNVDLLKIYVDGLPFAVILPSLNDSRFEHLPRPPFAADFRNVDPTSQVLQIDGHVGSNLVVSRLFDHQLQFLARADSNTLDVDPSDMTRVFFFVADGHNNIQPDVDNGPVSISLSGPGTLIGDAVYFLSSGAVWVRAKGQAGLIVVVISHARFGSVKVQIVVQ